jgi:hypothetical protein
MKIETPYELALRTLFDHLTGLEALLTERAQEAEDASLPKETARESGIQAEQLRVAVPAVREAIKRVMREDIARREPRMPLHKRVLVVDHYFERALSAARIRQGWNERVSAGV